MHNLHKSTDFEIFLNNISNQKPKETTSKGRPISHFTMLCHWKKWSKNPKWTFRGDLTFANYINGKNDSFGSNKITNELQALIKLLAERRDYAWKIIIYNNRAPKPEAIIYHYTDTDGEITNKIFEELKALKRQ